MATKKEENKNMDLKNTGHKTWTSVSEVFYYQILLMQLLGHFMFDWPYRWLALAYRCVMPFAMQKFEFLLNELTLEQGETTEPVTETEDIIEWNFSLYSSAYKLLHVLVFMEIIFTDFRCHEVIGIILRKRFEVRYFIEITSRAGQLERAASSEPRRAHFSTPNINFLNRTMLIIIIALALSETMLELKPLPSGRDSFGPEAELNETIRNDNGTHEFDEGELEAVIKLGSIKASEVGIGCNYSELFRSLRLLAYFSTKLLSYSYLYYTGQTNLILFVAACLNDMLHRVNEYNEHVAELDRVKSKLEVSNGSEPKTRARRHQTPLRRMREQTVPMKRAHRHESTPFETIQLLRHTRDVLIAMRQAYGFSYMVYYAYSMSEMLVNVGFLVAISSASYQAEDLFYASSLLLQFLKIVQERLVYTRLLDEVDAIRESYQKRLLDSSGRLTVEEQAIVKLAEEIGEIWPSGWIECDLQSYFSNVMSMLVFAISVQQAIAKRAK